MIANTGKIKIELIVDDKGSVTVKQFGKTTDKSLKKTGKSIEDANKKTQSWLRSWKGLSLIAAAATGIIVAKLAQAGGAAIAAASAAEETASKFAVVFKGQEARAEAWSQTLVDSYAMSTRESKLYLSSVQDLLVPMGMAADAAGIMSNEVVKLSADLGSFNDLPTAQVMDDIQSALVGNYETMKKYGVVLNMTTVQEKALAMGLAETKDALTAGHKAQAAYALMVEGSAAAIGDMERTSEGYANQLKALNAQFDNVVVALGEKLLPAATGVISSLGELLDTTLQLSEETALEEWAEKVGEKISEFIKFIEKSIEVIIDWWEEIKTTAKTLAELLIIGKITILLKDATESIYAFSAALTIAESRQIALNTATKAFLPVLVAWGSYKAGEWFTDWSEGISKNIKETEELRKEIERLQKQLEAAMKVKPDLTAAEVYSAAWVKAYEEKLATWFAATKEEEEAVRKSLKAQEKAAKEAYAAILKAQEKAFEQYKKIMDEEKKIVERFYDDYQKATLSNTEYQLRQLDTLFLEYDRHVKDKAKLDAWYLKEYQKILGVQAATQAGSVLELVQKWAAISDESAKLWQYVAKTSAGQWLAGVKASGLNWVAMVGKAVLAIVGMVKEILELPADIVNAVADLLNTIGDWAMNLIAAFDNLVDAVFNAITGIGDIFTRLIPRLIALVPDLISAIVRAIPQLINAIVEAIPLIINAIINAIPRIINVIIDAIPDIISAIISAIPEIAKALVDGIIDLIGSLLGIGSSRRKGSIPFFDPIGIFHAGGIVPHAHGGLFISPKLGHDERHIIALTNEGIVNRRGMQAIGGEAGLNTINRGDLGPGAINVQFQVNVINESGTPLSAEAGDVRFDGEKYITDVHIDALINSRAYRQANFQAFRGA